ncbi:MAG: DUF423 domain-containing protein [Synoicihabitans sp.]
MNKIPFYGAILAFLGVGLGAIGAHGLKDSLVANGSMSTWETAVLYHLLHAVAIWALGLRSNMLTSHTQKAGLAWIAGVCLFSGSLYVLALGGPRWIGPITPIGGLCFLLGWVWAAQTVWPNSTNKPRD